MKFIALLLVLALMQYWGSSGYLHRDGWYRWLLEKLAAARLPAVLQLLLATLVPAALVAWLLALAQYWLFGLAGLALNVVLLLYCLGRRDYEGLLNRYREKCREGDLEAAFLLAREHFPPEAGEPEPTTPEHLHRWMKRSLVYMGFERWFAVVFWYVLLGAPAALVYRLLHLSVELRDDPGINRLHGRALQLVDWLPARFLVLAFALTGDYMGSREQVASSFRNLRAPAADMISDAAHAALGFKSTVFTDDGDPAASVQVSDWEIGQLQGLLSRSAVCWLLVISIFVVLV